MPESRSLKISVYSSILTVLVIYVHAVNTEGMREGAALLSLAGRAEYFFSSFLGQLAVPGFFMLSGYLFFRRGGPRPGQGPSFFLSKWKGRVSTLLFPYLLWNAVYLLIHVIYKGLPADVIGGLFFHLYNPPFWFLWQLMLLMLLTPLVWLMAGDRGRGLFFLVLSLSAAVFYERLFFHPVNEDAFFYFYTGAFLALCFPEETGRGDSRIMIAAAAALLTAVLSGLIPLRAFSLLSVICLRAGGALLLWMCCMRFLPDRGRSPFFGEQRLFVYGFHYLPVRVLSLGALALTKGAPWALLTVYLFMPVFVFLSARVLYALLDKRFPLLLQLLGGRR